MTPSDVRREFLRFFAEREHRVVPSSPLVVRNDPTLLFANAGMNQFKDVFTGRDRREYVRATSAQKCLRVSGKHNDLEQVGRTPRHHTFFEMLGNFSFGDYFKREAIAWAWELVTGRFGLPEDRLWVTVFGGTAAVPEDAEALAIWRDEIGVPAERILRLGEADNFWRMGDTGPCGPCSEIHVDLGADLTSVAGRSTPETDPRRYLEIWNLVFMQFDQQPDGRYVELPAPSIDTGMGLERIASVLQGKRSNYDSELFGPILAAAARRAGVSYGWDEAADFSLRVIADHARAFCSLVADGVVPANDRRGYVLRRLLRRAIRHGRKLGITEPFLHEVTPAVIEVLGEAYPELRAAADAIQTIGRLEERRFADTLTAGLHALEESIARLPPSSGRPTLAGTDLFRLHDTFGFPIDLARDVAEERGIDLDEAGFEEEMARQRSRAQASWKGGAVEKTSVHLSALAERHATDFVGYETERAEGAQIVALLREGQPVDRLEAGQVGHLVLATTPFYAESGGQLADTGFVTTASGRAAVRDVQRPVGRLIVHRVEVESGTLGVGDASRAEIDARRRDRIRRNHTATHLVHAALREVVGTHVKQAGSLVAPDRLRFDFTHFAGLTDEALADIESLVNARVLENRAVETETLDLEDALRSGAMALFGEKYGDRVRVVRIGDFSVELCGGTHTARAGEIGLIKLTDERGVASGTRRVEAVTGEASLERFREAHALVCRLETQLSVSRDRVAAEVERRLEHAREVQKDLERLRLETVRTRLFERVASAPTVAGVRVLVERVDGVEAADLRDLADALRRKLDSGVVVLGRAEGGKASLLVAVTDDLKARTPAGELVRTLASVISGTGGGRADMAEAGGRSPERLDDALAQALREVSRRLEAV